MAILKDTCAIALLAVCIFQVCYACGGWVNNWDGPLEFECPGVNEFVSHVESVHSNHREDRRYKMSCRRIPSYVRHCSTRCRWTGYLNNYDDLLMYDCGRNGYINGFRSVHNNRYEDRRWRVRCCNVKGLYLHDCRFTGWTNNWDGRQNFNAPSGQITNGVLSWHKNHYEDRRWKYMTCKARKVSCTNGLVKDGNAAISVIDDRIGIQSNPDFPAFEDSSLDESKSDMSSFGKVNGDETFARSLFDDE